MPRDADLRASDADRELAVSMLQRAAAEGRLDADELAERVQRALRARTYGELAATVVDLPVEGQAPPRGRNGGGRRRGRGETPAWAMAGRDRAPRGRQAGGWAVRTVRANPMLLFVLIPLVAVMATAALAVVITWTVIVAVALVMGGPSRTVVLRRSRAWALSSGRRAFS